MKIVFQGKLPEAPVFNGKCLNCQTIVECEEKELITRGDTSGTGRSIYSVHCPTNGCAHEIRMTAGKYQLYL